MENHNKTPGTCRFVSFNVCGIKNVLNYSPWREDKTFAHMFKLLQADVICFQETKIQPRDLTEQMALVPEFNAFFSFPIVKKGYSGVAIYVRKTIPVLKAENGLTGYLESADYRGLCYRDLSPEQAIGGYPANVDRVNGLEIDSEGRALVLDIGHCVIIGLYCPANSTGERDAYRNAFFDTLDTRVRNFVELKRNVVVFGDLNVARELIDSAEGKQEYVKLGKISSSNPTDSAQDFLVQNQDASMQWKQSTYGRQILDGWISLGLRDTCRDHHPDRMAMYTCWNQKIDARPGNFGSRIDYVLTRGLECPAADILPVLLGSDHCPVYADIAFDSPKDDQPLDISDTVQCAEKELNAAHAPPRLCASYLSQFGSSHNIKSLFARSTKPKARAASSSTELTGSASENSSNLASSELISTAEQSTTPVEPTEPQSHMAPPLRPPETHDINTAASNPFPPPSKKQKTLASFFIKNIPDKINQQPDPKRDLLPNADVPPASPKKPKTTEWTKLLTPNPPPLCSGHKEPSKLMKSKKRGPNFGREFWMCAR